MNLSLANTDFGFSEPLTSPQLSGKLTGYDDGRLSEVVSLIDIFLTALEQNPNKKTLNWPNRIEQIADLRSRINKIVEGNND